MPAVKKSVNDVAVHGRRVLVRLDLNVPQDGHGRITDDRRIRAALPTIKHLVGGGGRLILMSHLGRPEGRPGDRQKFTLRPVADRLQELLGRPVRMLPECVGPEVEKAVSAMKDGDVCLLENLRFHEAETIPDKKAAADKSLYERKHAFAQQIANLGDVYVNDAFGTCHRDNASMLTVPQKMAGKPRVVGYLVQKELRFLGEALANPRRPFVCVLGGAKVSDKLGVIRALLGKCDSILIGGAMAYTFLAADGINVGDSKTEPDLFATARELRALAGKKLNLPQDSVAAERAVADAPTQTCVGTIPTGWMGLDIGSKTVTVFSSAIANAGTVFWNGPMGMFEIPPFDTGTRAIAEALSSATDAGAVTVVGGGDSAAAIDQAGLENRITHISTGGGASLEFLEGKRFAAIDILDDA